jgi:hypothetical protein
MGLKKKSVIDMLHFLEKCKRIAQERNVGLIKRSVIDVLFFLEESKEISKENILLWKMYWYKKYIINNLKKLSTLRLLMEKFDTKIDNLNFNNLNVNYLFLSMKSIYSVDKL